MKKLLYTLLAVSIIFSACEKEGEETSNTGNNNTIADVVGVWQLKGHYDASGNVLPYSVIAEACYQQGTITLQSDGNMSWTYYYFPYSEVSAPCLSSTYPCTFNYINSTTLEFIIPDTSWYCGNAIVTLTSPSQFRIPFCEDIDGYFLYEL